MPHALIIDDNQMNIDVMEMMLSQQQVSATSITSPRYFDAAMDELDRVDLVFLDLEIPNYDTLALFQSIKADSRFDGVPVVAYTVHTSEIDEARVAGFDSFLGKPLDAQRFPDQLRRLLSGEAVWEI